MLILICAHILSVNGHIATVGKTIVFPAKETGAHVPYGRLPLPAVDELLYELWPRE